MKERGLPPGIARALGIKDTKADKAKGILEGSKSDIAKDAKMLKKHQGKGRGKGVGRKMC